MAADSGEIFGRTALVAGEKMMRRLADTRVIIFGVGGVGSWCAEILARTGIGHLTLVDSDSVAVSNINRQLMATCSTVGRPKVDVLAERLRDINPAIDLQPMQTVYYRQSSGRFDLDSYDYVIDAIDSLDCKASLIIEATSLSRPRLFSSMGAALKLSASRIDVAEFWKVQGCPLARALRQKFKRSRVMPRKKFLCVYSPEVIANRVHADVLAEADGNDSWSARKAVINGTFAHTTAIFGLRLAGLVIEDIYRTTEA